MLILGAIFCVIGGVMWVGGAEVAEVDYENDSAYTGTSGTWDHDNEEYMTVNKHEIFNLKDAVEAESKFDEFNEKIFS